MKEKQQNKNVGEVIFFDNEQGYGTIITKKEERFLFMYNSLPIEYGNFKVPQIGQKVKFDISEEEKENLAINIEFME